MMIVENKIVYRLIRQPEFKVGDRICSRSEAKAEMEDLLEDVRRRSFSQMPSRRLAMFVMPSAELSEEWVSRLFFRKSTDYLLLKLNITGDLVWLDSDKLTTIMTEEAAAEYWSSELSEEDLASTDIVPEGLFVGSAKIEEVTRMHHCGVTNSTTRHNEKEINTQGWEAIMQLGRQAEADGIQDMSLDEVNAIIKEVRENSSNKGEASEMVQATIADNIGIEDQGILREYIIEAIRS